MARKLRVASESDVPAEPLSLLEAVESGDILAILKAQRRGIAEAWVGAAENTKPQFDQRLEKLNALIREEESRRSVESEDASVVAPLEPQKWDGTGF